MAKQTFTTGQVLTAAQMTSLQQTAMGGGAATAKTASYVLVAADAGTTVAMNAAGSTTITVNTGLFAAGDTVFIQNLGAGACTVTAGTATVATAGSLILPQNDAGILYFTATGTAIFYDYIQAGAVSPLTTKGDVYTFSTSDARLAVGANDTVLTADSAQATGLKWATPSAASSFTLLNSGGTALTGADTITVSGISGRSNLQIIISGGSSSSANFDIGLRFNGDTGANYDRFGIRIDGSTPEPINSTGLTYYTLARSSNNAGSAMSGGAFVQGANSTNIKILDTVNAFSDGGGSGSRKDITQGLYNGTSAITSVSAFCSAGTFDAGTLYIYGSTN
jgi:hypothetical protein